MRLARDVAHEKDPARERAANSGVDGTRREPSTVKLGTKVKWTNFDDVIHNVTVENGPDMFTSANFGKGASYQHAFTKPGVYHYLCTIHPSAMVGTIIVVQ